MLFFAIIPKLLGNAVLGISRGDRVQNHQSLFGIHIHIDVDKQYSHYPFFLMTRVIGFILSDIYAKGSQLPVRQNHLDG